MKTNSKLIALVICILCSISAYAVHFSFLGIPIDGTIENFDKQIRAKGFVSSADFSEADTNNQRWYEGTFANEEVVVLVRATHKSNKVHTVSVTHFCDSDKDMYDIFSDWSGSLTRKYKVPPTADGNNMYFFIGTKGAIQLSLEYDPEQPLPDFQYMVQLIYLDIENNTLAQKETMDDF
jgi:hypothetical protein